MKQEYNCVGKSIPRSYAHDLVTGKAKFTSDVKLQGMLVGKILMSPHPHANIIRVDKSKAEKLPGVGAVISFEDVPQKMYSIARHDLTVYPPLNAAQPKDMFVLTNKARYIGDPIAAVAAVDLETAEKALELIEVEYEVLPAVVDPLEAMKPGAPKLHDWAENNTAQHLAFTPRGDAAKGFAEADVVVEETLRTAKANIAQMEPVTAIASFDTDGKLNVWSFSQTPFFVRTKIAELFDIPTGKINWNFVHIGGNFGKLGDLTIEPIAICLAKKSGKPVKLEYTREEDFICTESRTRYIAKVKVGLKKDGTITALSEDMIVDGGAYFTRSGITAIVNMLSFSGLYNVLNVATGGDPVFTNTSVAGGCRGYGAAEGVVLLEQMIDRAAKEIGMDPLELRLKNIKKPGDVDDKGLVMDVCSFEQLIKIGSEKIGWKEKKARKKENGSKRYGIGMGIMMDFSGSFPFAVQDRNVTIKLNEDGSANIVAQLTDTGQDIEGIAVQFASEVLGISHEKIHVTPWSTDVNLYDTGLGGSAGPTQVSFATIKAAEQLKKNILERAGRYLQMSADGLEIKDGRIYSPSMPHIGISLAELVTKMQYNFDREPMNLSATGHHTAGSNPVPLGVVFAEVEVDVETGVTKLLNVLFMNDCGRIINPQMANGQVHGGIQMSTGYCLTEDFINDSKTGRVLSDNYDTYMMPSTLDMPKIEVVHYQEEDAITKLSPLGVKGLGHGTMLPVTPAILNAIYDATGVMVWDSPATPEKILAALKKQQAAK